VSSVDHICKSPRSMQGVHVRAGIGSDSVIMAGSGWVSGQSYIMTWGAVLGSQVHCTAVSLCVC